MGKTGNKKERRRVDREVAADLKKRNPRSTSGRSVPLQQNRAPVHTQTRVNGQLSREQKTIRNIAHKSGAGGCDPLMSSVIGAITHPFSKVNHVVMPRSNMSYLLNQNFVSGCGMTCDHRDIPRGTLNQYDYLVTATTSTSGNLRIDIPSFGAPFKTNATPGLTLAPLFSSTTYAGTTWTITNSVEAYGACPATGPGFSGVQEGPRNGHVSDSR